MLTAFVLYREIHLILGGLPSNSPTNASIYNWVPGSLSPLQKLCYLARLCLVTVQVANLQQLDNLSLNLGGGGG